MPSNRRTLTLAPAEIGGLLGPYRHTALLVAIIALLAVRPLVSSTGTGPAVYSIAIMLVLMIALYTIQVDELVGDRELLLKQRKHRATVGWVLALVAIALRLAIVFSPSHRLATIGGISWLLFFGYVTLTELRGVLKQKRVTRESISMSVSVYLLLGLTWGLFYILLFDFQPQAFNFGGVQAPSEAQVTPVLIYFSLTTLATVGYGDITPATLQARYAAVSEGVAGQFYLAILVARLVGMQMNQASNPPTDGEDSDSDSKEKGSGD
jgi:amino acid transporter